VEGSGCDRCGGPDGCTSYGGRRARGCADRSFAVDAAVDILGRTGPARAENKTTVANNFNFIGSPQNVIGFNEEKTWRFRKGRAGMRANGARD
jgi:hypothetical protein